MKYISIILSMLLLSSCSVFMAGSKDTKPLTKEELFSELNEENFEDNISNNIVKESLKNNNSYYKIYKLEYDQHAKGRMYSHLFWGIITLGIKEIVNTPGEALVKQTPYYVKVTYLAKEIKDISILNEYP